MPEKAGKISLDKLHLWDKNPRIIKDKRFETLCKSMTDDPSFLELRPILATKDGRIYAGNMRYRAAKHLGWIEIPAVITDISEKLARERAIKDNNEYSEWNNDELATLLDEMEKNGTDISTLGLDEQINKILENLSGMEIDAKTEWEGMPEFNNPPNAYHTLHVHFKLPEDLQNFSEAINQDLTKAIKTLWYE